MNIVDNLRPEREDLDKPAKVKDVLKIAEGIEDMSDRIAEAREEEMEDYIDRRLKKHKLNCDQNPRFKDKKENRLRTTLREKPDIAVFIQSIVVGLVIGVGYLLGLI